MPASASATSALLHACEDLHANLGDATPSRAQQLLQCVLDADAHLQTTVTSLLIERDQRAHAAALKRSAEETQSSLLELATRMHAADGQLIATIERAREALAAADEGEAAGRHVPVATIIEYAERVSYSNAAPCGPVAFAGAERCHFYQGWGTPTPQQHMVAASHFARVGEHDKAMDEASPEQPAGPTQQPAPAFTAVASQQAATGARVSLSLGDSDDEDDDF